MKINLGKTELIHFIGIGGIGMSGLAIIMNGLGFRVTNRKTGANVNSLPRSHRGTRGRSKSHGRGDSFLKEAT